MCLFFLIYWMFNDFYLPYLSKCPHNKGIIFHKSANLNLFRNACYSSEKKKKKCIHKSVPNSFLLYTVYAPVTVHTTVLLTARTSFSSVNEMIFFWQQLIFPKLVFICTFCVIINLCGSGRQLTVRDFEIFSFFFFEKYLKDTNGLSKALRTLQEMLWRNVACLRLLVTCLLSFSKQVTSKQYPSIMP